MLLPVLQVRFISLFLYNIATESIWQNGRCFLHNFWEGNLKKQNTKKESLRFYISERSNNFKRESERESDTALCSIYILS